MAKRISVILIGSVLSAYGITMGIYAGYGGATLAVLWQGVAKLLHIGLGSASMLIAVLMILFALVNDKKQIHIGTLLYQVVYSGCVELFSKIQHPTAHWALNLLMMVSGIVIFAVGAGLYSSADFGRGSYEAVTFALADRNGWQIKYVRMVLDASVVVLGVLLGGRFGLCTIATVLLSGPIIQATERFAETRLFGK